MDVSRRKFLGTGVAASASLFASLNAVRESTITKIESLPLERPAGGRLVSADVYSLDPSVTYLNHASIGTTPRVVQEAHKAYLDLCETNPWLYMWSEPWKETLTDLHEELAMLLGCSGDEIAITHNTTELFNTLAHGLPLGPGDEVLYSSLNHGGASICFQYRSSERGFSVRQFEFPLTQVPNMSVEDVVAVYDQAISPATRLLVLPHIDNMIGLRNPLKEIASMAHDRGVKWVAVDGAQTANMIPVDLHDSGVDMYATSAHKWLQSPKGLGIAYVKKDVQEELRPMWVTWGQKSWSGTARIFEDYGTRALAAVMALGDALTFHAQIDMSARQDHHVLMWKHMQSLVEKSPSLGWASPRSWELGGALYGISFASRKSTDAAKMLFEDHGIVLRPFRTPELNLVRVSPNVANGPEDLEKLVEVLRS